MSRTHIIGFRVLLIVAATAIMHLATTPQEYPVVRDISDKAAHILAFYVLGFLVDFSFPLDRLDFSKVVALLAFGLLIEVIQSFLPHRTASLFDLAADGMGIAVYGCSRPVLRHVPWLSRRWMAEKAS